MIMQKDCVNFILNFHINNAHNYTWFPTKFTLKNIVGQPSEWTHNTHIKIKTK